MKKFSKTHGTQCYASIKTDRELSNIRKKLQRNDHLRKMTTYCALLGNTTRLRITHVLVTEKGICVCDLANILRVSVAAVSQHLRKMKELGVIDSQKRRQTIFYFFKNSDFKKFLKSLNLR